MTLFPPFSSSTSNVIASLIAVLGLSLTYPANADDKKPEPEKPAPSQKPDTQRVNRPEPPHRDSAHDGNRGASAKPEERKESGEEPRHPENMPVEARFRHLQEAAEHLALAGLHEESRHVRERAEQMKREMQPHPPHSPEGIHRELDEMRRQIKELRAEVSRLRERQ